ncbi:MAG: hypothetical protein AB8H79_15845 [Myxococcota bacterium]
MLLLLSALAMAAPESELHIGNSYTFYNNLPEVREALHEAVLPDNALEVRLIARGGARLANFAIEIEDDRGELADLLRDGPGFDRVFLQEQSQLPAFPQTQPEWTNSKAAMALLRNAVPESDVVVLATWGRRDGDRQNPSRFPDFETMNDLLFTGTLALADGLDRTWIAPAGRAFAAVRADVQAQGLDPDAEDSLFYRLYDIDGSHPAPLGTLLTACVEIGTVSGVPCDPAASWPLPATDEEKRALTQAAAAVTLDVPFGDLSWPWAYEQSALGDGPELVLGPFEHRPAVRITSPLTADALTVHGPLGGRIYIPENGALSIGSLQNSGPIELYVTGGTFEASGAVQVSPMVDAGTVQFSGTRPSLSGLTLGSGGTLALAPTGDPTAPDVGTATLNGTLAITVEASEDAIVLLTGTALTYGDTLQVTGVPEGWTLNQGPTALSLAPATPEKRCATTPVQGGVPAMGLLLWALVATRRRQNSNTGRRVR